MKRSKVRLLGVVGARPNFMKMAPLARLLRGHKKFTLTLVHTGQHYDAMSDPFFRELRIPAPKYHLKVGSRSAAKQVAQVMSSLIPILEREKPQVVFVVGDVNSTLAASLAAHKLGIQVAHIEAGLRSFDNSMPEEINRRITDSISSYCFTHSPDADRNLRSEGVPGSSVYRVGNLMIDTLLRFRGQASASEVLNRLGLRPQKYGLLTLHRPSNVDREADLRRFHSMLKRMSTLIPIVFPVHPRTANRGKQIGLWKTNSIVPSNGNVKIRNARLILTAPLSYFDFLRLQDNARFVMTDSGGVQEETTALGVPCLTLRKNTERPVTITSGTNTLAGTSPRRIESLARNLLRRTPRSKRPPRLWDGHSADRLLKVLEKTLLS